MRTKPNMAQLKVSFGEYVENAHRIFKRALSEKQSNKIVRIHYSEGQRLMDLVNLSKKHPSYQKFYDTAMDLINPNSFNFPVHPHSWEVFINTFPYAEDCDDPFQGALKVGIDNFFFRSTLFLDLFRGRHVNIEKLFSAFCESIAARNYHIYILVPFLNVSFAEDIVRCGICSVAKIDRDSLSDMLSSENNAFFYSTAFAQYVDKYKDHCFIIIPFSIAGISKWPIIFNREYDISFSESLGIDAQIETIFEALSMFRWLHDRNRFTEDLMVKVPLFAGKYAINHAVRAWKPFCLGTPMVINDLLLEYPDAAPANELGEYLFGNNNALSANILFNEKKSKTFASFMSEMVKRLELINELQKKYQYLQIAREFFFKAFYYHNNIDQFMAHMICIESLVGGKSGTLEKVRRRAALIMTKDITKRKGIETCINKIYNIRSRFVHGEMLEEALKPEALNAARHISRELLVWFVNINCHLAERAKTDAKIKMPAKKEILEWIDLGPPPNMPRTFPYVRAWLDAGEHVIDA